MRRWAAAALFHAGVPHPLVTQALRHATARSDESYILESAKLTSVPAAPRMPPLGMPVFAAATPGGRFDATAGPRRPPAGLGLLLRRPEHRATVPEAVGLAAKGVLIATGRTPTRTAAGPSPRGRFSEPPPPGPGCMCGTPRTAASSASRSW